ncbi:hypothetical protein V6N13_046381 [Hibiscus sabdariffa]|uniref:Uncharacterized protein n=1 Tax=Hibiscus sabdariffa TaxID=183260 RepID=A0ABR2D9Z6_9ROSI
MREGDEPKVPNDDDDIINWVVRVNEKSNLAKSPIVNSETGDPSNFSEGRGYVPKRALKDVSEMGLSSAVGVLVKNGVRKKTSWVDSVEEQFNGGLECWDIIRKK